MKNLILKLFGLKTIETNKSVKKYNSEKVLKYFSKQRKAHNIKEDIFYNKDGFCFQFSSFHGIETLRIVSKYGECNFNISKKQYSNKFRQSKYHGTDYIECEKELILQIKDLNLFLKSLSYKLIDEAIKNPFNSIGEKKSIIF